MDALTLAGRMTPRLFVCPEGELAALLADHADADVLSFGSPSRQTSPPATLPTDRFHQFAFNDIPDLQEGLVAASQNDVSRIIAIVRASAAPTIVFQCWFGVSRSTAAVLIAAAALNTGGPAPLARRLRDLAPFATPNPLMIRLADGELGLNGALISAVADIGRGAETSCGRTFEFTW